jgi:hypothetical protein
MIILILIWLPGTDYSRCALTLRVALRAIDAAVRRRRTVLFSVGGANFGQQLLGCKKSVFGPKKSWLPGTDSNRRPTD